MSWSLIKSIQNDTDLRLIMPFGLNLKLGDVVSVSRKDGSFTLEGTSASILSVAVVGVRPPQSAGVDLFQQSGKSVSVQFRAQGTASTLFPELPKVSAGFDIAFSSANSWLLALLNRQIATLDDLDRFRRAILASHHWGVWKPDWCLITSIATADQCTLIASNSANTNVAVALSGKFDPAAPVEIKLTSGASIVSANQQVIQLIVSQSSSIACSGLRVRDHWWSDPTVGALRKTVAGAVDPIGSSADAFWQSADSFD